jgi:uncharacterized protein YegL
MFRRLPVYLLLDCSESMAGPAIESVTRGVADMATALRQEPSSLETVFLSVITFGREARQVIPLTSLNEFRPPALTIQSGTCLGAALDVLAAALKREVVRTTPDRKGDYRPLAFLFTDGQPTDAWRPAVERLQAMSYPRLANFYAIGCGPDVDLAVLQQVTDIVLQTGEMTPETLKRVFVWMTASVQSLNAASLGVGGDSPLAALPPGVLEKAPPGVAPNDGVPRQVFLHARCQVSGKDYLMRYVRGRHGERYVASAAHPLPAFAPADTAQLPPINTSMLEGIPACPYCQRQAAAVCECTGIFCYDHRQREVVHCPHCQAPFQGGGTGNISLRRAAG